MARGELTLSSTRALCLLRPCCLSSAAASMLVAVSSSVTTLQLKSHGRIDTVSSKRALRLSASVLSMLCLLRVSCRCPLLAVSVSVTTPQLQSSSGLWRTWASRFSQSRTLINHTCRTWQGSGRGPRSLACPHFRDPRQPQCPQRAAKLTHSLCANFHPCPRRHWGIIDTQLPNSKDGTMVRRLVDACAHHARACMPSRGGWRDTGA